MTDETDETDETTTGPDQPPTGPLLLGPVLRRSAADGFGVWVEVDRAGEVIVTVRSASTANAPGQTASGPERTCSAATFCVAGHHYALVDVDGLEPGPWTYEVALDERPLWPDPYLGSVPTVVEIWEPGTPFRISGGSCRQQAPQDVRKRPSWFRRSGSPISNELGADALAALSHAVQNGWRDRPHLLVLSGDQVYADERHESMTNELEKRRGGPPPEGWPQVAGFDEYTWLYQRTWSHPLVRWILASIPSVMIFDDHDVIDDWNTSDTWAREIAREPWWRARLDSALMAYWVYQHLGNLTGEQRGCDDLYREIRSVDDGETLLRDFAAAAGTGPGRHDVSWSYTVGIGPAQMIVLDGRNGRVLDPDRRSMLSSRDWDLLEDALTDNPNALIVTSVPWLLPPGVHHLERFVSQIVAGRWGGRMARFGERIRRAVDLEHWAAFGSSVEDLADRLAARTDAPERRWPPVVFSGDVHFAYLAAIPLRDRQQAYQIVSSPMRQGDAKYEQLARWAAMTSTFDTAVRRLLARGFRRKADECRHRVLDGIWTDNNIASLEYGAEGRVHLRIDRADLTESGLVLEPLLEQELS